MGILNATPDSFSDGGKFYQRDAGLKQAEKMIAAGVDVIDIGGESTRPGAEPVALQEELDRVLPVIEALKECGVALSIDTYKPETMRAALDLGVDCVNDIWAFRQEGAVEVVKQSNCGVILMHMQRDPQTMQFDPHYDNVLQDVQTFLLERCALLEEVGIASDRIIIDPGFGFFAKTLEQNYEVLHKMELFKILELPILVGVSRKSMIYKVLENSPQEALNGTSVLNTIALQKGAKILRVHDVKEAVECIKLVSKLK